LLNQDSRLILKRGEYTIPEALEEIARHFRIDIGKSEHGKRVRNSLDRTIRLDIKRLDIAPSSKTSTGRKTRYRHWDLQRIIDKRILYFVKVSEKQHHSAVEVLESSRATTKGKSKEKFDDASEKIKQNRDKQRHVKDRLEYLEDKAKDDFAKLREYLDSDSHIADMLESEEGEAYCHIEVAFENRIDDIIKEFILEKLIKIDRVALRRDIEYQFENNGFDPLELWEIEGVERLRDNKNYYKPR